MDWGGCAIVLGCAVNSGCVGGFVGCMANASENASESTARLRRGIATTGAMCKVIGTHRGVTEGE
jgi:hypothetical protein